MDLIRIGTRASALALGQTQWVKRRLEERYRGLRVEVVTIKTSGDRFLDTPVKAIGGKGIFVKEIEEALIRKQIDLAVHSMKDMPTEVAKGLTIAAVPEREDSRDVLVSGDHKRLKELSLGATIGTGSLRRRAQLLRYRSDLSVVAIRGNVDTRLKKLDRREVDALVMAAAGLKRIGQEARVREYLPPEVCLEAVGQGALALESRDNDPVIAAMAFLHHPATALEVAAERSFLRRLGGGCQIPVGGRAWVDGDQVKLMGVVADPDGQRLYRQEISGSAQEAERLGWELAERMLASGADEVLALEKRVSAHGAS